MKVKALMTEVLNCTMIGCTYNKGHRCHAKGITVGNAGSMEPECDTVLNTAVHIQDLDQIAGVGACKVSGCMFNKDFECAASEINVGKLNGKVQCLTFKLANVA